MGELVPFRRRQRSTAAGGRAQHRPMHARSRPVQDTGWLAAARGLGPLLVVLPMAAFTAVWLMDGPSSAEAVALPRAASPSAPLALADSGPRNPAGASRSDAYAAALEAEQPLIGGGSGGSAFEASPANAGMSAQFSPCRGAVRTTCVVDGDTIWYQGTKIRVADINAPEVSSPGCAREAMLGEEATERLTGLLNAGTFTLVRPAGSPDRDKYGRALRELHRNGQSLGAVLVDEGLAEEWGGARIDWC